ncbi:hypothetical protein NDU88_005071 [Pleurodeles waltl]|uniref:Uncharacterized protein n=1 Tax=Pleurodeles waltl TaxID=8319 RepID=A0AAV7W8L0_PLEWA|nr:hypothetical protein NDU88_005071 [Pleurodeles waltl]
MAASPCLFRATAQGARIRPAGAIAPLRPDFQALRAKGSDPVCPLRESTSQRRSVDESGLLGWLGSLRQIVDDVQPMEHPGRDRLPISTALKVGKL